MKINLNINHKSRIRQYVLSVFLIFSLSIATAQIRIAGKVIDSATSKPLADASVYIANSTLGTKTDENGAYSFVNLKPGNYEIIASCLGYKAKQGALNVKSGDNIVNLALAPRDIELKEVVIGTGDWKINLNKFKQEFIGTSNSQECAILNAEVLNLHFDYAKNRLIANTSDFLEIQNNKLGYKLRFLVKEFWADYNTLQCHYAGSVIFEELKGKKSDLKNWTKNRQIAYNGSFRHFLTSLAANQLVQDRFIVKTLTRTPNTQRPPDEVIKQKTKFFATQFEKNKHAGDSVMKWAALRKLPKLNSELGNTALKRDDLMIETSTPGVYQLQFPGYVYIIYQKKSVDFDFDDLFRFKEAFDHQISALSLKTPAMPTFFDSNGLLLSKDSLLFEGAWDSRIVDLLPFDYMPEKK